MDQDTAGRLRSGTGWHDNPVIFSREIEEYVIDCAGCSNTASHAEFGLYAAQEGIEYMSSPTLHPSQRLRPGAALITVFMTDEEDNSVESGRKPDGRAATSDAYERFFESNTDRVFAITGDGSDCGSSDGLSYREVAYRSGGASASLCQNELEEVLSDVVEEAVGASSVLALPSMPISSTLRVWTAAPDGVSPVWVPRSRQDGFDYFPETNTVALFGSYRSRASSKFACSLDIECATADERCRMGTCELAIPQQIAVHYETFLNKPKFSD